MSKIKINATTKNKEEKTSHEGLWIKKENEIIYYENKTKTKIKIDNIIEIERKEEYYIKIILEKGIKKEGKYITKYGNIKLETLLKEVKQNEKELEIIYDLYLDSEYVDTICYNLKILSWHVKEIWYNVLRLLNEFWGGINMNLNQMTKEELEQYSYKDIAQMILSEEKTNLNTRDLFKKVCDLLNLSEDEYINKIGDFYTSLTTDKTFILLENGNWDLSVNHSSKIKIEEDIEDEDDLTETEEEMNDELDDMADEEMNGMPIDDAIDDDMDGVDVLDDASDDDLTIIDEDELDK